MYNARKEINTLREMKANKIQRQGEVASVVGDDVMSPR
jgi:hypothetical protein